jgi:hypothetical protein
MQFRVVRKSAWRRRVERCEVWLTNTHYYESVKVRNLSSNWVNVTTTDPATGHIFNRVGMGAGDHTRYHCFCKAAIQVIIEIPGASNIVVDWDFRKQAELHLFDDDDGDNDAASTATASSF